VIRQSVIFELLEDAGRAATGGRQDLTLRDVVGQLGTRATAQQLGISQREVQRAMHERGEINPRTGRPYQARQLGPRSIIAFRELGARELRRAGARALRNRNLTIDPGSSFALCYGDDQQGDDREIRGDPVVMSENDEWLDHFEAGDYELMAQAFSAAFMDAYFDGEAPGDLDVCDEDGGANLSFSAA
jgi:hypothetical protein